MKTLAVLWSTLLTPPAVAEHHTPWYPYNASAWSNSVENAHPVCSAGHRQSPIDLPACVTPDASVPAISVAWGVHPVTLVNNGHTVQVTVSDTGGKMTIGSQAYTLVQCHFHMASEHRVSGKQKPMETHCVHTKDGKAFSYGVLGLLWDTGSTVNEFLQLFENRLPSVRLLSSSSATSSFTGPLDLDGVYQGVALSEYWSYSGSLTTPPCTEAVDWFVLQHAAPMTLVQLGKFKAALGWAAAGGNFRVPQPLHGRVVGGCSLTLAAWSGVKVQGRVRLTVSDQPAAAGRLAEVTAGVVRAIAEAAGVPRASVEASAAWEAGGAREAPAAAGSLVVGYTITIPAKAPDAEALATAAEARLAATDATELGVAVNASVAITGVTLTVASVDRPSTSLAPWYPYNGNAWSKTVEHASEVCSAGHMQSPVDLPLCVESVDRSALAISWGNLPIQLENTGHNVQATVAGPGGRMTAGNESYTLVQCHWHWGSEHRVGGEQKPMSVHCVHTKDGVAGRYGVLAVLYAVSSTASSFLALIEDQLPGPATSVSSFKGPVNFDLIYSGLSLEQYWTYDGSLTTPPCTEAVDWRVLQSYAKMTGAQLSKFQHAIGWAAAGGNFRLPQPLNGRTIVGCRAQGWYPYDDTAWTTQTSGAHPVCTSGQMQSPIDLPKCTVADLHLPVLSLAWGSPRVELTNNGNTVQVAVAAGATSGRMTVGVDTYTLLQCHFHYGSEHVVGGEQLPAVVHCVHTKDGVSGRYGVLGVLYKLGDVANSFLGLFETSLPASAMNASSTVTSSFTGPVNFDLIYAGLSLSKYWSYSGSFTTPPCTEAVDWHVLQDYQTMTQVQLTKLQSAIGWATAGGNYRPPQPRNGREIKGCGDEPWYPYSGDAWSMYADSADAICTAGKRQSPVDLPACRTREAMQPILAMWGSKVVELSNTGHAVQLDLKGAGGKMAVGTAMYTHLQCHYHWGSEHWVSGQKKPLAAHCVHSKDGSVGRYGVLGVLYEIGPTSNIFLESLEGHLPTLDAVTGGLSGRVSSGSGTGSSTASHRRPSARTNVSTFVGPLDLDMLYSGLNMAQYWSYDGSFTTPPCTEAVDWYVLQSAAVLTRAQLDGFRLAIGWGAAGGNHRPPQPLHDRAIRGCALRAWYPYESPAWASDVVGANQQCASGVMQSPVDLPVCEVAEQRAPLSVEWGVRQVKLTNNGHTVLLEILGTGGLLLHNGSSYRLLQCHFHIGSEHTIGGRHRDMEAHCVHDKTRHSQDSHRFGVLSIFYKVGISADPFLELIEDFLPANPSPIGGSSVSESDSGSATESTFKGPLNFNMMPARQSIKEYYTYYGSLTTPPCSEVVDWFLMLPPVVITQAQLDKFKAAIAVSPGNNRPPQPLNGRKVWGCRTLAVGSAIGLQDTSASARSAQAASAQASSAPAASAQAVSTVAAFVLACGLVGAWVVAGVRRGRRRSQGSLYVDLGYRNFAAV